MQFVISALSGNGRVSLNLDAKHAEEAAEQARRQGLTVLSVKPAGAGRLPMFARRYRFPISLFSRELLSLLGSGLSLMEALQTLAEKEARAETRKLLMQVLDHLYQGESLSSAIARYPDAFPPLYVASVRASEKTSNLPEALTRFIAYQEQLEVLRKKVTAAAVYPVLLLVLGSAVALFLLGWVVPRFASIYEGNLERLPLASRWLMQWGVMVQSHAMETGLVILLALTGVFFAFKQPAVRAALSRRIWRLPGLGERLRVFQLTRFYRTVGMLLSGGIPVLTALTMSEGLLHPELRLRLANAAREIREGKPISDAMEASDMTTPVALRMLRVGEKSGRMGEMMESIASFHDEELERAVDWFTRLIEPILMIVIGLTIGVIVVLLYMPIFELAGSLE
ncbi:MAG: type II secretion system protein [Hydrogenophilales bacterium 28-61-23]|nr:MAG: type II secretion system protein [Hydrogenophilales bacterium 28-61-23]